MNLEGKISVKHYLNKKLLASSDRGKKEYPLYVRISFQNKVTEFKSRYILFTPLSAPKDIKLKDVKNLFSKAMIPVYSNEVYHFFTEADLKKNEFTLLIDKEKEVLTEIVSFFKSRGRNIIKENSKLIISACLRRVFDVVDNEFKTSLRNAIEGFGDFRIVHHVIDWNQNGLYIFHSLDLLTENNEPFKKRVLEKVLLQHHLMAVLWDFETKEGSKIWIYAWFLNDNPLIQKFKAQVKSLPEGAKMMAHLNQLAKNWLQELDN